MKSDNGVPTEMRSVTELLEAIADLGGDIGKEARSLLPWQPPLRATQSIDEMQRVTREWLDRIDRVVWRAQSDPVLRPHCEDYFRGCDL